MATSQGDEKDLLVLPQPAGHTKMLLKKNEIWHMDMVFVVEFEKLKHVLHTIDTYSGFQWAMALSLQKNVLVITHLLEVMTIMGIPAQIKINNPPAYSSKEIRQCFAYYKT